jgi:hypothetical protein
VNASVAEMTFCTVLFFAIETVDARFADNDLDIVVMVLLTDGVKAADALTVW